MMRREIPLPVVVIAVVVVLLLVVGIVIWRQRSAVSYVERVREEVEQEQYREGELGHPPGQPPVTPRR